MHPPSSPQLRDVAAIVPTMLNPDGDGPIAPIATDPTGRVHVKVLAGQAYGVESLAPITLLHFTVAPGAIATHPVGPLCDAMAYVISGQGYFGAEERPAHEGELVIFHPHGAEIWFQADEDGPLDVLFLSGASLAGYSSLVLNIAQAFEAHRK